MHDLLCSLRQGLVHAEQYQRHHETELLRVSRSRARQCVDQGPSPFHILQSGVHDSYFAGRSNESSSRSKPRRGCGNRLLQISGGDVSDAQPFRRTNSFGCHRDISGCSPFQLPVSGDYNHPSRYTGKKLLAVVAVSFNAMVDIARFLPSFVVSLFDVDRGEGPSNVSSERDSVWSLSE